MTPVVFQLNVSVWVAPCAKLVTVFVSMIAESYLAVTVKVSDTVMFALFLTVTEMSTVSPVSLHL